MKPVVIRYVRDVPSADAFYEALGLARDYSTRPTRKGPVMWTELAGDGGTLALHHLPEDGPHAAVELCFEAGEPLEDVVGRLRAAGYEPETEIVDESFGRSVQVRDPEGLLLQVNEHDRTI
jgi:catechol 2,3-dioxygenase-like lactoylglutathione lyase family enzyme